MYCNTVTLAFPKSHSAQLDLDFQTPLILDESFDFSDPEESRFAGAFSDGLLAKSGGLFSMSAYEKSPQADFLDYDATRALHDTAGFSAYAQPPYVTHLFPSALESHTIPDDDSVHYVTNEGYSGSHSFDLPRSPVLDLGSRQLPEVASYTPLTGHEGSKLSVYLQCPYDFLSPAAPTSVSFLFGSERCECVVTSLGFLKSNFQYVLSVDVPPFAATGCPSLTVPLQMIMEESEGQGAQAVHVGVFTYDHNPQSAVSPAGTSRKRRLSDASDETSRSARSAPVKQLRIKEPTNTFTYSESLSGSPYSPYLPTPTTANVYPAQYHPVSPRPSLLQYPGTTGTSQPMIKAPSPLASSWSPSFATVNISARSPGLSMTPNSHSSSMPSPVKTMNPILIRTSTIQHLAGAGPNQAFNPYAMYPSKAVLKIDGDLDSMTENWSPEERTSKRRLVHFTRRQSGSIIHADFKAVAPADRAPNSICISCIYWDGKKECYVTSVDTIYLLESLVGVRFTVEEKNRIRRNLEGFRPLTVSKAKPDSEDFFKVIMGFPNPKPRNIEKDVKVFPWRILSHALKKIIGKYSASYSSTAGALTATISSNYVGTSSASDGSADLHATSPRSISETGASTTYATNVSASGISPHFHAPKAVLDTSPVPGAVDLRLMVTNNSRHYSNLPAPYPYQNINHHQQPQAAPTAPGNRGPWDFGAFVNSSPGTTAAPNHSLSYARQSHLGHVSQDYAAPPVYSLGHPTTGP
ncbi:hypothetical protein RJZ56_007426 [Blastomyces dermatitidis]|uniref:Transcriptional regulator n=1 Tax=Ajellomyces dermatitidis (strain ATCC 18188 / CBS 674.68) TaxID=653446 RepID=F2TL52_AJEDA|nr:transcriptional regulator [Blastomyces dermatitidis ATCC 18188]